MFKCLALPLLFDTLLAFGVAASLHAQSPDLRFEPLTVDDGLPNNWVRSIYQDRLGFMWFVTEDGLVKYDGYDITMYRHDPVDSTSISNNVLSDIHEDRQGVFWVGSEGGLDRFDPVTETFTHYRHNPDDAKSISSNGVGGIYEDRAGTLWIGTEGGLNRFDPVTETFKRYVHDPDDPTSISYDVVSVLYEDAQGVLWIGTGRLPGSPEEGGLNRFDPVTETFKRYRHDPNDPTGLLDNRVTDIYEDARGRFWIGTSSSGLNRFDRATETFTRFRFDPDDPNSLRRPVLEHIPGQQSPSAVKSIHEEPDGVLWFAVHHSGLVRFDPATGTFRHYAHDLKDPYSPTVQAVNSIYKSRDGTRWIGTLGGGVNKVSPGFRRYEQNPEPPYNYVFHDPRAIHEDASGVLWLGTQYLLVRWDRDAGTVKMYKSNPDEAFLMDVWALHEDRSGALWVGTPRGLDRFDPERETFTPYRHDPEDPSSLSRGAVLAIHEDRQGRLWIGTEGGLNTMDRETGTFTHYRLGSEDTTGPGNDGVPVIYEDRQDRLWIGARRGLYLFEPTQAGRLTEDTTATVTSYLTLESAIKAVHEDQAGRFWIGTERGLELLDREKGVSTLFSEHDGLSSNTVRALLEDDAGRLWVSTDAGLSRFDPTRAERLTEGKTKAFQNFDVADGVFSRFSSGSAFKSSSGELFFGSYDGLLAFYPDQIEKNTTPPEVVLTGLRIFNEPVVPDPIELAHDQHALTFDYVGLHYKNPAKNQYRYKLENYDEEWVEAGSQRSARYTKLPHGEYVFRVQAANSDGIWNEEGASIRVVIHPPWWRTPWAYLLYGLLFIAGVFAVDRFQRRRLIRKERERAMRRELEQSRQIEAMNEQLREHEQQLEDQNRKLLVLDQLKSRFFANISHEFRTPLTLITGPLQDALNGTYGPLPEALQERDRLLLKNARRLLRLINQLLDLAKLESDTMALHPAPGDLSVFLRDLVRAFTPLAERRKIMLRYQSESEALPVRFDADKLEMVFGNVLSNALKFTPEGGKVWVTVNERGENWERGPTDDVEEEVASPWCVEVVIKDTGPGIPKEALTRIFDRFQQVDGTATRAHEGTGIGLALAKELVALHGGQLLVESEPGFGSAFTVRLPLEPLEKDLAQRREEQAGLRRKPASVVLEEAALDPAAATSALPAPTAGGNAPTILVVEDNAEVRAFLRRHLEAHYHIIEAADGAAGLEAAREARPDLILSDVMMPGMDGYALCQALKADDRLRSIPVVLLTARASEEDTVEGLEGGADDYIAKPFSISEVRIRVANLIASRQQLRRQFSQEIVVQPAGIVVSSEEEAFLAGVLEVVEARLGDSTFGVNQLADEVGMSRRHLTRRVRALTSEAPGTLIRRMRLERAAHLLAAHAGTVSEIAYAVGFQSASHFSVAFRDVFGTSPSDHVENGT